MFLIALKTVKTKLAAIRCMFIAYLQIKRMTRAQRMTKRLGIL